MKRNQFAVELAPVGQYATAQTAVPSEREKIATPRATIKTLRVKTHAERLALQAPFRPVFFALRRIPQYTIELIPRFP